MAIAHVATEYVFSDFLLKEPTEGKYRGVRLELAADKLVTFIAVGLPLLLISLAFAQEVSVGECCLEEQPRYLIVQDPGAFLYQRTEGFKCRCNEREG